MYAIYQFCCVVGLTDTNGHRGWFYDRLSGEQEAARGGLLLMCRMIFRHTVL